MSNAGRRHGSEFEKRIRDRIPGAYRHPGLDGDVHDYLSDTRIECKYRVGLNLESGHTLRDWLSQVFRYAEKWPKGQRWALCFTGGKTFRNAEIFVIIPFAEWRRLVEGQGKPDA